jgi:Uma2 family endonuclease
MISRAPSPRKTPATYADLEALPPHVTGQLIDGELVALPRPALAHATAATTLSGELVPPFQRGRGGPGGWIFWFEPELHLGAEVLVPDLAGWRRERVPEVPAAAFMTLAPDWVCEVVSPASASVDRIRKPRIYAREGVGHYWVIDPLARTLEVLRLDGLTYRIEAAFEGDDPVRAAPFEAIELDLSALWTA